MYTTTSCLRQSVAPSALASLPCLPYNRFLTGNHTRPASASRPAVFSSLEAPRRPITLTLYQQQALTLEDTLINTRVTKPDTELSLTPVASKETQEEVVKSYGSALGSSGWREGGCGACPSGPRAACLSTACRLQVSRPLYSAWAITHTHYSNCLRYVTAYTSPVTFFTRPLQGSGGLFFCKAVKGFTCVLQGWPPPAPYATGSWHAQFFFSGNVGTQQSVLKRLTLGKQSLMFVMVVCDGSLESHREFVFLRACRCQKERKSAAEANNGATAAASKAKFCQKHLVSLTKLRGPVGAPDVAV